MKTSGAKVNWNSVCKPKEEAGLEFRVLEGWNKVAMVKHIWAVCQKSDTLWVKWVHNYVIKSSCFWTMKIPQNASWTIRKLLKLRSLVQP